MIEKMTSAMNLLELPSEVLKKIISYVPDQLTIAQTCKTFYEISCRLKSYEIKVRTSDNGPRGIDITKLKKDKLLNQSIVNSKRKINAISLDGIDVPQLKYSKSVKKLFEKFGRNLTELRLDHCKVTLKQFLNRSNVPGSFQLDLPNLRDITINDCPPEVLKVFNKLPDNVLTRIFVNVCQGTVGNALGNQLNIKDLTWFNSGHLAIDIRNLQLLSLKLCEESYSRDLLTGQGSLTSLRLFLFLQQADIDTISTLANLVQLEFRIVNFVNLSSLQKLTKLTELVVFDFKRDNESFETLRSSSLNDLTISSEPNREFAVTLSSNCPNIQNIRIGRYHDYNPKAIRLSSYLEKFPKLEIFMTLLLDDSTFPIGFVHHNLKRLQLYSVSSSPGLQNLLESCVALETFGIHEIDWKLLKTVLTARPNLKALCVEKVNDFNWEFIITFWNLGKNLKSFHIKSKSAEEVEKLTKGKAKEIKGEQPHLTLMKAVRAKKTCCKE